MKTPKKFKEALDHRTITKEMLVLSILSVNKRAKNMRDQQNKYYDARVYWNRRDIFNNEYQYMKKKKKYYAMKDELLSFLSPSAIHLDSNNQYYLFYDCGLCSFHSPIQEKALDNFSDLTIVNIGDLKTQGKDIHDLVSLQFVKKLIELLQSGNFKYLDSNEISESKE